MIGVLVVSLAVVVLTTLVLVSRMRPVDRLSLGFRILIKLRLVSLLATTQSKYVEIADENGLKILIPEIMASAAKEAATFKTRQNDVIVATYPKAGTTWVLEIVWLICNNADFATAKSIRLVQRYGYLETPDVDELGKGLQALEKWPTTKQRLIKTHLPFQMLPKELQQGGKCKMICVARNPKDNCVSFFHFHRAIPTLPDPGSWDEFLSKFCQGQLMMGDWFSYVKKYWEIYQERKDRIYFVLYEDLKKDLKGEVAKLAKFLEVNLSEEKIEAIAQHCTFDSMSKNDKVNMSESSKAGMIDSKASKFMRKGQVGDWKNHFTINQNALFDEFYKKRTEDWALKFEFEPSNPI